MTRPTPALAALIELLSHSGPAEVHVVECLDGHGGYDVVLRLDGGYLDQWDACDEADATVAGLKALLPSMKVEARYGRIDRIDADDPGLQR